MKKIILAIAALFFLGIVISLALFFLKKPTQSTVVTPAPDPFGNLASGNGSTQTASSTAAVIGLKLQDGSLVTVPDFTKENQPAWAGPSGYLIVGSPTDDYMATYIPPDGFGGAAEISIILENEPLGAIRTKAETALREKLRLTNDQLCHAGISVYTQPGLSDIYDAKNLGLSFCSGSVKLP